MSLRLAASLLLFVLVTACSSETKVKDKSPCEAGSVSCDGHCIDLQSDPQHCGACGGVCDEGEVCSLGGCELACANDLRDCDGACVDVQTSSAHCGACGASCGAGEICEEGSCTISCAEGLSLCVETCLDLQTDRENCGACGTTCAEAEVCVTGSCRADCPDSQRRCGGSCVDVEQDDVHCGGCNLACEASETCVEGSCEARCAAGEEFCEGSCIDPESDQQHCGACGTACGAGELCEEGACSAMCLEPASFCEVEGVAACFNLQNDTANCGACEHICEDPENAHPSCAEGACGFACEAGWGDCDTEPANGCELRLDTDTNCGACGNTCQVGVSCIDGACPRRVFVTSTSHNGNLGGYAGADAICQGRADAAGLVGRWRAVLSDEQYQGFVRLQPAVDRPIYRLDGVKVAGDWTGFTSPNHLAPINVDENLDTKAGEVWIGHIFASCGSWTQSGPCDGGSCGRVGLSGAQNSQWSFVYTQHCDREVSLYCLED